jgi:hypothetical protein
MPATYTLIASNTLSSSAASVTFSAIPATYTDLVLRMSLRSTEASNTTPIEITFNSDTATNYSVTRINGDGSAASSSRRTSYNFIDGFQVPAANGTSNTFSSTELYIPNYTASQNKPMSLMQVDERNTTAAEMNAIAGLWRNTAAITSITLDFFGATTYASGSSFFLYGIKNS